MPKLVLRLIASDEPPAREWPPSIDGDKLTINPLHLSEALEAMRGTSLAWGRLEIQNDEGVSMRTAEHFGLNKNKEHE